MRNVVFKILYYKEHARKQIESGVPVSQFNNPKDVYYEEGLVDVHRVETVTADVNFKGHSCLTMYSGDVWVVKIARQDYFRLIDHISADKIICRMKN